jgi:hypothetical protein
VLDLDVDHDIIVMSRYMVNPPGEEFYFPIKRVMPGEMTGLVFGYVYARI